ncbi:serine protease inhibitor 88Ea-like isoform X1 [Hylaeus volcanicus]|uniref:serine protease inhibitor 88Ea-like isoform X1 n=1 Tax=Hylaeus volcanicus TaxID=313075 RepID=UPI0023B847FB|nr:serine protease inhibitor 88Ea-like isoform X1 [Hylaeus volcanicus]
MFARNTQALSVLPVLLLLGGVSTQCLTGNDSPAMMNPSSKKALTDARYNFALDTMKKAATLEQQGNIFFSPHSIYQALSLAYFGARGTTEEALRKALNIPHDLSKVDVQRYYSFEKSLRQLSSQKNETPDYELASANRLWITDKRKVRECMLDLFGDQLEKTDFQTDPNAVRERINDWVSNMTKGNIRDILPPNSIQENTDLVLANAVYFKGFWQSQFDPAESKKDLFYSSASQNSMVTFMHQKGVFNYMISETLGAHILELPYKGDDISMVVMLPPFATARAVNGADGDGMRQLIERMSTADGASELREILSNGMDPREVEIYLPRFEIEMDLPMGPFLRALGVGELMTPGASDLRGFLQDGESPLHLGDAVHRARIEVTEEGTTAAAATALFTFRSGRPLQLAVFNANHPFMYFIYNKSMKTVLFNGIYRVPPPPKSQA